MRHTMRSLSDLQKEAENYFRQMKLDQDAAKSAYKNILDSIDQTLKEGDYASLSRLIPYIEKGDGHLAFQYMGKTHRFLRMLHIIALENKYQKVLFCNGCNSVQALWEKYMLTLFALRRLCFQLSQESMEDAISYLHSYPISHFAVYIIAQDELLIPDRDFYKTLVFIYKKEWTAADQTQFYSLTGML